MQPQVEIYEPESFTALNLSLSQNEEDIQVFFYQKLRKELTWTRLSIVPERASMNQVEDS